MACFHPIHGFRAPGGTIKLSRSGAYRDLPVTVACGQCSGCRLERSRQWAIRIMHEAQMHEENSFLTLTYKTSEVPQGWTLDLVDWQSFAKRLRKKCGKFRFYHAGEYTEDFGRPHLHACIFGLDFHWDRKFIKLSKTGHKLYRSPTLDEVWPHGHHWIGDVTFESAAYVARYIMKKVNGDEEKIETHYEGRRPEYATMSRRPGLGTTWFDAFGGDVYPSDQVITSGHPSRPPKFYDALYELENPTGYKKIKALRGLQGSLHKEDNTPDRLEVREQCHTAKINHYKETSCTKK